MPRSAKPALGVDHGRIVDVSGKCPGFASLPSFNKGAVNRNATTRFGDRRGPAISDRIGGGKASCQIGRSLLVAEALGLSLPGLVASHATASSPDEAGLELPDLPKEMEEPDGRPADLF
jgi:hypothetical protein